MSSAWNPACIHPARCRLGRTASRSSVSFWKVRQHGSRQWQELAISNASSRINAMVLPSKAYEEISGGRRDVKTDPVAGTNGYTIPGRLWHDNIDNFIPVVLHKAAAEVSKIGSL